MGKWNSIDIIPSARRVMAFKLQCRDVDKTEILKIDLDKIPSLTRRGAAYLLDVLIVFGATFYFVALMSFPGSDTNALGGYSATTLVSILILISYQALFIAGAGKTIGCFVFGLEVISLKNPKPSLIITLVRAASCAILTFLFFPIIFIIHAIYIYSTLSKNPYRELTWDKASGTLVIKSSR